MILDPLLIYQVHFFHQGVIKKTARNDIGVISAAKNYVMRQALRLPAAVLIGVAQSACLGMKDTRSPLRLLQFCEFYVGGNPIAWLGGAAGAA